MKINAEFDTVEKTLAVLVDGKPVENVSEVYFMKNYSDEKEFGCSVMTAKKDETNDTYEYHRLIASELGEAQSKVASDIHRYFGAK